MRMERARLVAGIGAALALAGGCGGSSRPASQTDSPSPTASSPVSPTGSPAWSAAQRAVITGYVGFWRVLPRASQAGTDMARARLLIPVTTDPELSQLFSTLHRQRQRHQMLYGLHVAHVESVEIIGTTARLKDCQDASAAGIETTGGRKITVGVRRNPVVATLLQRGDVWKVSTVDYPHGVTC